MPGATPQSTMAMTLFFLARSSSFSASSGKKEMSTMFFPDSITV